MNFLHILCDTKMNMCFDDSLIAEFDMFAQTLCACCEVYRKVNDMNFIYCLAKLILQI